MTEKKKRPNLASLSVMLAAKKKHNNPTIPRDITRRAYRTYRAHLPDLPSLRDSIATAKLGWKTMTHTPKTTKTKTTNTDRQTDPPHNPQPGLSSPHPTPTPPASTPLRALDPLPTRRYRDSYTESSDPAREVRSFSSSRTAVCTGVIRGGV